MGEALEELICKAIPLPTCPQKRVNAMASRVWLKREIEKLYEPMLKRVKTVGPRLYKK